MRPRGLLRVPEPPSPSEGTCGAFEGPPAIGARPATALLTIGAVQVRTIKLVPALDLTCFMKTPKGRIGIISESSPIRQTVSQG